MAVSRADDMVRQCDLHGAEPFRQSAGQMDVRPAGQDAVPPPLFDGEPAAVPAEQCIHGAAPVMIRPQPVEGAPFIVKDEQV